jgi:hypothetical protein
LSGRSLIFETLAVKAAQRENPTVLPLSEKGSKEIGKEPHQMEKIIAMKEKCKRRKFRAPYLQGDATYAHGPCPPPPLAGTR